MSSKLIVALGTATAIATVVLCASFPHAKAEGVGVEAVVIYQEDGTVQCENVKPRPLDDDAAALTKIGAKKICGKANVQGPLIYVTACGYPTGLVNAIAIPKADWEMIQKGIVGTLGFRQWPATAPLPKLVIDPSCHLVAADRTDEAEGPQIPISQLKGMILRVYKTGDALTEDFRKNRVNIELSAEGKIVKVWIG